MTRHGSTTWRSLLGLLALLVCVAHARPGTVYADGRSRDNAMAQKTPAGFDHAIELAFKEFELGNYAEARAHFWEAHRLQPSARTLRALGMVEFELSNYVDAIGQLEQALSSNVRALEGQQRSQTEELLARAQSYVARVSLELNPIATRVSLDGAPIETGPGGTLLLQVGNHELEFQAQGRQPEKRLLKIKGGEQQTLHISLAPDIAPTTHNVAQDGAARTEKRSLAKNPWLWTAVGIVVVGAAVGTAAGLGAFDKQVQAEPYSGNSNAAVMRLP